MQGLGSPANTSSGPVDALMAKTRSMAPWAPGAEPFPPETSESLMTNPSPLSQSMTLLHFSLKTPMAPPRGPGSAAWTAWPFAHKGWARGAEQARRCL